MAYGENQASASNALSPPQPRLIQLTDRNMSILKDTHELYVRLATLADRLVGPAPEVAEKDGAEPQPSATVSNLESQAANHEKLLRKMRNVANRLETM